MRIQALLQLQVLLICLAVFVIADDMKHPERWDMFYRDPSFSIPFCVGLEAFILTALFRQWRKQQKMAEGERLLEEANRLLDQGLEEEAEVAYREGCRLCGLKRR